MLRNQILPLRNQLGKNFETSKYIPQIIQNIDSLIGKNCFPKVIAGYYPVKGELNVLPILKHFHEQSWIVCLPRTGPKHTPLDFVVWEDMDPAKLIKGKYNIPIPSGPYIFPNIVLAPLVGFTDSCGRLGYGGGYYDKTIRRLKSIGTLDIAIGIAYELQKCSVIPFEETDEPLDAIVTEKQVYRHI